jgi:hypothetical protein
MGHDGGVADQLPPGTFVVVSGPPASGKTTRAQADLRRLPGNIVEVFCRCDPRIAQRRYAERAGARAVGHFAAERTAAGLWNDEVAQPVAGGWPVLEVGTNDPVDAAPLTARIRAATGMAA